MNREVLEGGGGLGSPRVDDDDAAAPGGDRVQLVLDPRSAEHAAVGDQRVGADHEQEVGAGEVGDRDDEGGAVEEGAGREAVGDVLGRGGVGVGGAERVEKALDPERMRVREGARIAHVPADRVAAVAVADAAKASSDLVQGLGPGDALERAVLAAAKRVHDPVGIVLDLGHGDPLGAGEAARERMLGIGLTLVSRPSSTVATMPHSGSQIRQ